MTTVETETQMDPPVTRFQAILTAFGVRCNRLDFFQMSASVHFSSPELNIPASALFVFLSLILLCLFLRFSINVSLI